MCLTRLVAALVLLQGVVHSLRIGIRQSPVVHSNNVSGRLVSTLRLPVWPVYGGVAAQVLDWMNMKEYSQKVLSAIGGRVIPMSFMSADSISTSQPLSPFLLLVHHQHSFMPFDPTRTITNLFLPEGFPAHPHSGFSTVTITIDGGLKHRDSEGIIMDYGDGDTQWMASGRGVIHEEMWNTDKMRYQKIELYQLWINLPERDKYGDPAVTILRNESIPVYCDEARNTFRVICGSLSINDEEIIGPGNSCTSTPLAIIQVKLKKNNSITINKLSVSVPTAGVIHVTRGEITSGTAMAEHGDCIVFPTVTGSSASEDITVTALEDSELLLLMGEHIDEATYSNGPFIASNLISLAKISRKFNNLKNPFWSQALSNDEFKRHVGDLQLQARLQE